MAAIEKRIDADLALGHRGELVTELEGLVAEHPLREHLRAQLMLALYRCGRQADALEVYRRTSSELSAELGLEPGRELRELESAILSQDPSLEPLSPTTDVSSGEPAPDREPAVELEAPRRARKVVTVLFCEVTGSTALGEELDPEALFGVMSRYSEELRAIIERHGGTVAKFIGDAVMGVFGIPRVHEEDALRAVRTAAEIRMRLPALAQEVGVELRFRTGVNTGLVLVGEGENLAIGDAVNVAARLEHAAQPGEILLGEATHRLVRDAVEAEPLEALSLKGRSEPVAAFRLLTVDPLAPGLARRFDVPLVGRQRELRVLREAWDRAVAEAGCHLFTLLGAAGVGKSRLVAELLSGVGDEAQVLAGRCLPYGEGITFWPLLEALTSAGEKTEAVLERLRSGGTATPHELFLEVRLTLESLAGDRPLLVHIDDLQWAEPLLLDLLDHIVELSRDAPIVLLCTARPELLEDRPAWGGGKLNATTMMLEPLGTADCEALLVQLGNELDPPARARVVSASEGNPLFLEEMSALVRETGSYTVPSTIQALLAARLERLAGEEQDVLERGAVEGEVFHRGSARSLAGGERSDAEIDELLAGLVRKDLIRPHASTLPGDRAFRFRHLLIRDAAYDSLPKTSRAELHERLARALELAAPDLAGLDEIAGWHLEQAIRYRRELGQDVSEELNEAASEHLHWAGLRARERGDVMAAMNLLERARLLAPEANVRRARIGLDLAEQLIKAGEVDPVDELLTGAQRHPEVDALTALTRLEWMTHFWPPGATQAIESQLPGMPGAFRARRRRACSRALAHAGLRPPLDEGPRDARRGGVEACGRACTQSQRRGSARARACVLRDDAAVLQPGCGHDLEATRCDRARAAWSAPGGRSRHGAQHGRLARRTSGRGPAADPPRGRPGSVAGQPQDHSRHRTGPRADGAVAGRPCCRARDAGALRRDSRAPRRALDAIDHTGIPGAGPLAAGKRRCGPGRARARRGAGRHRRRRHDDRDPPAASPDGAGRRGR